MNEFNRIHVNRIYKSRLFEMIFSEKKELLELYNAINHTDYDNPELLEINLPITLIFHCGILCMWQICILA